jgi:hypothetical protein
VDALDQVLARRSDWPQWRADARRFVETERHWARSAQGYLAPYRGLVGSQA